MVLHHLEEVVEMRTVVAPQVRILGFKSKNYGWIKLTGYKVPLKTVDEVVQAVVDHAHPLALIATNRKTAIVLPEMSTILPTVTMHLENAMIAVELPLPP